MKTVTVAEAQAGIARLLRLVRKGETVVVMSRGKPVAEIRPVAAPESGADPQDAGWSEDVLRAAREGKLILPKKKPDWKWLKEARERLSPDVRLSDAIIEEREEGM